MIRLITIFYFSGFGFWVLLPILELLNIYEGGSILHFIFVLVGCIIMVIGMKLGVYNNKNETTQSTESDA